jgi:hypothetical protein
MVAPTSYPSWNLIAWNLRTFVSELDTFGDARKLYGVDEQGNI